MEEISSLYHENGYYETVDLIAADLGQLSKINPPVWQMVVKLGILLGIR